MKSFFKSLQASKSDQAGESRRPVEYRPSSQSDLDFSRSVYSAALKRDLPAVKSLVTKKSHLKRLERETSDLVLERTVESGDVAFMEKLKSIGLTADRDNSVQLFHNASDSSKAMFMWMLNSGAPWPSGKDSGSDSEYSGNDYTTIFGCAARYADENLLRSFFNKGQEMNADDLMSAASVGLPMLQLYVDMGEARASSTRAFWAHKASVLGIAINAKMKEVIPFFISKLRPLDLLERLTYVYLFYGTPLVIAATYGEVSSVILLAEAGVSMQSDEAKQAVASAIYRHGDDEGSAILEALLRFGVEPNTLIRQGQTAISYAAEQRSPSCAWVLLAAGANPDLGGSQANAPKPLQIVLTRCTWPYRFDDAQKTLILLCAYGARISIPEPLRRLLQNWVNANSSLLQSIKEARTYEEIAWPSIPLPFLQPDKRT